MASSHNKEASPLAALAPLHALAQLVPAASPETGSEELDHEGAYILLTSLEPDAWVVHVGRPDGRWWNGAWRVADMKDLAVRIVPPLQNYCIVADEVCIIAPVE
jgi:hypothetical protein